MTDKPDDLDEPKDQPLFMTKDVSDLNKPVKPEDMSWGDWTLKKRPFGAISFRHKQIAMMKALGASNKAIADKLGFCESRMSVILSNTDVTSEITNRQDKLWSEDIEKHMKSLGPEAMNIIEGVLTSTDPNIKPQLQVDAAKWLLEKLTGKAKQEVEVSTNIIGDLYDKMDAMTIAGKQLTAAGTIIDIQAEPVEEKKDELDEFLDDNPL